MFDTNVSYRVLECIIIVNKGFMFTKRVYMNGSSYDVQVIR